VPRLYSAKKNLSFNNNSSVLKIHSSNLCLWIILLLVLLLFFQPEATSQIHTSESLNGWWKFYPILTEDGKSYSEPTSLPGQGQFRDTILVPGSWAAGGIQDYMDPDSTKPWSEWRLFDNYGYPDTWDMTNSAWYYRTFTIKDIKKDKRYFLFFGGVLRESFVFVNGHLAGHGTNGIMPYEYEITDIVRQGFNQLHVFVTDYRRDAEGKTFTPTGADQMVRQKGIWQDVYLVARPEIYLEDITIRTSTRNNELTLIGIIRNASGKGKTIRPNFVVLENNLPHLSFEGGAMTIGAGQRDTFIINQPWDSYIPWSPETPQLYYLETILLEKGKTVDIHRERFGFREIWIEGHRLMLNGHPVHLFGEWGHKYTLDNFRPEYILQWYRMLKDCNMNYIRTHTFPHPTILLDLADEIGILVSLEAAWHFGGTFALENEEFWQGAMQHVREIIKRDKNHPSIILWSVGNEVRWSGNQPAIIKNVPRLRKLYEELDPTRIPYHDGDSPLWDEQTQYLMSRHYGPIATGEGWWDKSRPLHIGEVGKWHYGQPIDNYIWGDDTVFASFEECHKAIALECADLAEQARANEVSCFFPWNLSCLDNFRPWPEEIRFEWNDPSAPYIKPLRVAPYGSEFAWWEPDGKGYVPGVSFEIMKKAFRPFAIVTREKRTQFFDDDSIQHTLSLINDMGSDVKGILGVQYFVEDKLIWSYSQPLEISRGYTKRITLHIPPGKNPVTMNGKIVTKFYDYAGVYDIEERYIRIFPEAFRNSKWKVQNLTVYGHSTLDDILKRSVANVIYIDDLSNLDPRRHPLLLIQKGTVISGSVQNRIIGDYVKAGGKVVILEQQTCLLPSVKTGLYPSERCHISGGKEDILKGFTYRDFEFWGDDPYGLTESESWVTEMPYFKPAIANTRILLYSGYGDFGKGGFLLSPLFEVYSGSGIAMFCQLSVTDNAGEQPAAYRLLQRILEYTEAWVSASDASVKIIEEKDSDAAGILEITDRKNEKEEIIICAAEKLNQDNLAQVSLFVENGGQAIIYGWDQKSAKLFTQKTNIPLEIIHLGPIYNLIRVREDPLLEGITNQETYWLDDAHYPPPGMKNRLITNNLLKSDYGEELLISEIHSAWREFFTLGGRSERTRMPIMTYYLWNGPREHGAGLMRIPYGKGEFILCQVPVPDDRYEKAMIFWNQLLNNVGIRSDRNPFDGESVPYGTKRSNGYPVKLNYTPEPSDGMISSILRFAQPAEYHMENFAIENTFQWQELEGNSNGDYLFEEDISKFLVLTEVNSERARKEGFDQQTGLPDPVNQTMVDIFGNGKVTLWVNGKQYEPLLTSNEKPAMFTDINLEKGWNTVLILYEPLDNSPFRIQWKNRQIQPEVEFDFK
jgi:beta-galactosidase